MKLLPILLAIGFVVLCSQSVSALNYTVKIGDDAHTDAGAPDVNSGSSATLRLVGVSAGTMWNEIYFVFSQPNLTIANENWVKGAWFNFSKADNDDGQAFMYDITSNGNRNYSEGDVTWNDIRNQAWWVVIDSNGNGGINYTDFSINGSTNDILTIDITTLMRGVVGSSTENAIFYMNVSNATANNIDMHSKDTGAGGQYQPSITYDIFGGWTISSPSNGENKGTDKPWWINWTSVDDTSSDIAYSLNGASYTTLGTAINAGNHSIGTLSQGSHTLDVRIMDNADNSINYTEQFNISSGPQLILNFSRSETGYILTNNSFYTFSNVNPWNVTINYGTFNLSEGRTIIGWNQGTQTYTFNNDGSDLELMLGIDSKDLLLDVLVYGPNNYIKDALLTVSKYNDTIDAYERIVFGGLTDQTGEIRVPVDDESSYIFEVDADGYQPYRKVVSVQAQYPDTMRIDLIPETTSIPHLVLSNCMGSILTVKDCNYTFITTTGERGYIEFNYTWDNASYSLVTTDSGYTLGLYANETTTPINVSIYFNGLFIKKFVTTYEGVGDRAIQVVFDWTETRQDPSLLKLASLLVIFMGILIAIGINKALPGWGIGGMAVFFGIIGYSGLYVFYVPAILIGVFYAFTTFFTRSKK